MAVKHVDLETVSYTPQTSDNDIIVEVQIGDAADEDGSYSVFLGPRFIGANAPANIGKKADVGGKTTVVSVTIVDTLMETNWTSMTVFVREGDGLVTYGPYSEQVDSDLDTIIYTLKITNS